ncbi:MAG: hydroxyectoine utilization dehydratase EutB [Pseudomonadota bacterium]
MPKTAAAPQERAAVTIEDIDAAAERIAGRVRRTALTPSPSLSERSGAEIRLKLEHQQITGSFKLRGATNALLSLDEAARARGVVAVSTGNHGRALAHAAQAEGAPCHICLSSLVPANKVEAIKALGATVHIAGVSQDEAEAHALRLAEERGLTAISPFDDARVIAGQGTLGLELAEQFPEIETALIPLSGGGLLSGVALALKARRGGAVRVIGVSQERGPAMAESLKAGAPVEVEELPTLADSLGGGVGLPNRLTFALVRSLMDELILVSEAEIAAGIRHAYWAERQVIEGGAAVGIAALLSGKAAPRGPTAVLTCGQNIDMALHHRIISGEDVDLMRVR